MLGVRSCACMLVLTLLSVPPFIACAAPVAQDQEATVDISVLSSHVFQSSDVNIELVETPVSGGPGALSVGLQQVSSGPPCLFIGGRSNISYAVPPSYTNQKFGIDWDAEVDCTVTLQAYVQLSDGTEALSSPATITVEGNPTTTSTAAPTSTPSGETSVGSQLAEFQGPQLSDASSFGRPVAISGPVAVVGDYLAGGNVGEAYVYQEQGSTWQQTAVLQASDPVEGANFGIPVAVSGDTIVIGANHDFTAPASHGRVYVFSESATGWSQTAELAVDDAGATDNFGEYVGISGGILVAGNFPAGEFTEPVDFDYVFDRTAEGWQQEAALPAGLFSCGLAISGATIASSDCVHLTGADAGNVVHVFTLAPGGWQKSANLSGSASVYSEDFGDGSLAISGSTIVVGAPNGDRAYVFGDSANGWKEVQVLTGPGGGFGVSVSVSGSTLLVGANGGGGSEKDGAGYIFALQGPSWQQVSEVSPGDTTPTSLFGKSVAISGNTAIVGSPGDPSTSVPCRAYVFQAENGPPPVPTYVTETVTPAKVSYPGQVQVSALLGNADTGSPLAGQALQLLTEPAGGTNWSLVAVGSTSSTGTATFSQHPSGNAAFEVSFQGATGYVLSISSPLMVTIAPRITSVLAKAALASGAVEQLTGRVAPPEPGQKVYLQHLTATGWSVVGACGLTGGERFHFHIVAKGTQRLRVELPATNLHPAATSTVVTLRATV